MKIILIGYGNVGKELYKIIHNKKLVVDIIVRNDGIYDSKFSKIDDIDKFHNYVNKNSIVFISTPSKGKGELSVQYYIKSLDSGASIITCEKAFLANNWEIIKEYPSKIKYSAAVGGDSGILNAISSFEGNINNILAVVNGTLNYVADKVIQGVSKEEIYKTVVNKGFAEPGAKNFYEVIENELIDVLYKTSILANHSGFYGSIIKPENLNIKPYRDGLRCLVSLNKNKINAGFITSEDISWFPSGVNNVLYINNQKIVEGPGAGGKTTAERMFKDFEDLIK